MVTMSERSTKVQSALANLEAEVAPDSFPFKLPGGEFWRLRSVLSILISCGPECDRNVETVVGRAIDVLLIKPHTENIWTEFFGAFEHCKFFLRHIRDL